MQLPRPRNAPPPATSGPDLYIKGGFLYFRPPFHPSHEVREWGGRWDNKVGAWRLPRLVSIARDALAFGARTMDDEVKMLIDPKQAVYLPKIQYAEKFERLYPFQKDAVGHLVTSSYHGTLLALSPGLGKTPVSIVAAECAGYKRILVVSPLSLVPNWVREHTRWSSHGVDLPCDSTHQEPPYEDDGWTVTNYDTVRKLKEQYAIPWDLVIYDESVLLKSRSAQRTQACKEVANHAEHVWLLSGSPVTRDYSDLWAQLNIIQPEYFTSFWRFTNRYCVVEQTAWGTEILGSRHGIEMKNEFPEVMFVRNQDEVLPDLPEIIFQEIEIELTKKQAKAHKDLVDDWVHRIETGEFEVSVSNVISELIRLQQVTSNLHNLETTGHAWPDESAKADAVVDLLTSGEVEYPVLIWTQWRPGAAALVDRLRVLAEKKTGGSLFGKRIGHVMGGMKDIPDTIDSFKAGSLDVLVMSLGVGKYGHTLTDTRTVVYLDKSWDSDAYFQSLHRVRRIGLNHRPLVISLRAKGTVDEFVEANLAGKMPSMANVTGADLTRLLTSLGPEYAGLPL